MFVLVKEDTLHCQPTSNAPIHCSAKQKPNLSHSTYERKGEEEEEERPSSIGMASVGNKLLLSFLPSSADNIN